jgi:hypothetical protein
MPLLPPVMSANFPSSLPKRVPQSRRAQKDYPASHRKSKGGKRMPV